MSFDIMFEMEKSELFGDFLLPLYIIDRDTNIDRYINEHEKELTGAIVENFRDLLCKVKALQSEGKLGKIKLIAFYFNLHNFSEENNAYFIHAVEDISKIEGEIKIDNKGCRITYDAGKLKDFLDNTCGKLIEISQKYKGKISDDEMRGFWDYGIKFCSAKLLRILKGAVKEVFGFDEFKSIDKEETLETFFKLEKYFFSTIYKINTRIGDSKEIKEWLESGEENYSRFVFQNLDLSRGNYKKIICYGSDFSESDLSHSNFEGADLGECSFLKSILNGVNFKKSKLSATDFRDNIIENSDFQKSEMMDAIFKRTQFINCNLSEAQIYTSVLSFCSFKGCNLSGIDFILSDLENADLSYCDLRKSTLSNCNLTGADLSNSDFTGASFEGIDFTTFKFDNAIFADNKVLQIIVYKKDLHRLKLSKKQMKEVTVVD